MRRFSTRKATAILAIAASTLASGTLAAQTTAAPPAALDAMCDYCGDYTDAGVAAQVTTAYRPIAGYPERRDLAAASPCTADGKASCGRPATLGDEVAQIRTRLGVGQ